MFDMYPKFINEGIASDMKLPPLGVAAMRGNVELIQFLLKMGADINGVGD